MPRATQASISMTPEPARRTLASMNHRVTAHREQPPTAIEQALDALHVADAAGRAKLPVPPPGYEWHSELVIGEGRAGSITARLVYSVRSIID